MIAILVEQQRRIAMLTFERIATKPVVFQMLTGLSLQAFLDLLPAFHRATAHIEDQAEQRRKQPRQRSEAVAASRCCARTLIAYSLSCSTSRSSRSKPSK